MNSTKKAIFAIAFAGMLMVGNSVGSEALAQEAGRRRQGPPPEAYTACEGKSAGDMAEFESSRGDTVTGTCEERDGRLVLHPDNPRGGGRGMKGATE